MRKIIIVFLLPLFAVSLLCSQSLVELSKKEKERRAMLKGKATHVVTNSDLTAIRKRPAVTVVLPESEEEEPGAAGALENVPSEEVSSQPSEEAVPNAGEDIAEVEKKLKDTQDMIDLLTLKINSLWVKFYSFEDWTVRDEIQRDMNDTNTQLEQAKQDVENLKLELSRLKSRKQ